MNLETFFENFELLADAPNGVQKLRELILQLAVQGKLVKQDANDEPASVLLEKIKAEKDRLVKEGKIKKEKPLPAIQSNEIPPYELPTGWEWCRFGQVMDCYRGHNPPKDKFVEQPKEGYVRFIQITDFKTDEKAVYVPISKNIKYIYKGEIAMAAYRHIGKVSRDVEGAFNVAICKVMEIPPMSRDFIEKLIGTDFIKGELLRASGRAHIPSMHTEHLLSLIIPLPPLKEQHRIVAKVDELMALCDELESRQQKRRTQRILLNNAALDQLLATRQPDDFSKHWRHICNNFDLLYSTPENIGKLRQTILQLAVQGKLVPQDANDEPASVLLDKIKFEKELLVKEGKISKSKQQQLIEKDNLPFNLPQAWEWSNINNVTVLVTDGEHATPTRITTSEVPLATAKNVRDGYLDLTNTDFVSYATAAKCWQRCEPMHNDILMVCVGATTGRLCLLKQPPNFAMVRSVSLIRPFTNYIYPEYMAVAIKSPLGQSQIWNKVKQSAQPCLYINKIQSIYIPIPPLEEQKRIITKLDQLMLLCDELETKLTQTQTNSEKLMDAAIRKLLTA